MCVLNDDSTVEAILALVGGRRDPGCGGGPPRHQAECRFSQ